jgi:hypothetical protein
LGRRFRAKDVTKDEELTDCANNDIFAEFAQKWHKGVSEYHAREFLYVVIFDGVRLNFDKFLI